MTLCILQFETKAKDFLQLTSVEVYFTSLRISVLKTSWKPLGRSLLLIAQ